MAPSARNSIPAEALGAPLRILIADDESDCRESLEGAVELLGYSCTSARDGQEALEMYETQGADVILADWEMPRMDGVELCRRVREEGSGSSYTHFIFVTGLKDKEHFIHGMGAGADDYLAKPVDLDELEARLTAAQRLVTRDRELRAQSRLLRRDSERAHDEARTDPLTEALNRRALDEDLDAFAARAVRYGHHYCAALCDVDHFKAYNDHFGHLAGDEVLKRVALTIRATLRRGDALYRYGGEEFLVVLPEQSLVEAMLGVDRVRQAVEDLAIRQAPAAAGAVVTLSAGIACLQASSAPSVEKWLGHADSALYVAKGRGRNCIAIEGEE